MIIKKIYLGRLAIPLKTPFVTALRRVEAMDELMVFIETGDGRVGHGEAPPTAAITGDTIESMTAAMQIMAPMLIERDIETDFADILNLVHNSIPGCPSGKAALEMFKPGDYDLVLLDIQLPDMTGLDISRELTKR